MAVKLEEDRISPRQAERTIVDAYHLARFRSSRNSDAGSTPLIES